MKKLSFVVVFLVAVVAYAASTTIVLTPDNSAKHDVDVVVKTIPQTIKEGDKPVRVTGHSYHVTITSEKLKWEDCHASLLLEKEKESYLLVPLKQWSFNEKTNTMQYRVTFSPDYADHTYILLTIARSGANDYKLKIKDWIKPPNKRIQPTAKCRGG